MKRHLISSSSPQPQPYGSEGSVHSQTRRALEIGAKPDEVYHAIILLTSTIGFPTVSAALSWADDVIAEKK